ncbi:hypothetical protein LZD49_09635 [Dyadobacter sp. CY261]|uniref:hypothetical protein n=1 Tax=Dyadobacter sp. CY261 TaxID=2907203 RepID=UPI001F2840FE|nr:hypothetical protein [Dyadobacter sp. CY261]MCF0070733.1 hypothetical protein [Dyadobacter sp. CY261]
MKAILFSCLLLCSLLVRAQQFSPTTGVPCPNCVPANYNAIGTPFISDISQPGIDVSKTDYQWYIYLGILDNPPSTYSQGLPVGAGKDSFVSLKTSEGAVNDKLYLDVSGFDVNKTYTFRYSVCGVGLYYLNDPVSPLAASATMEIATVGQNPNFIIASQTTDFVDPAAQQHWTKRVITFKPTASTLRFRLSGKTPGQTPGYVHFSIDKYPFDCQLPSTQVELSRSLIETPFPNDKLDLSTVGIKSVTPPTTELVWKAGPNSTDATLTPQQAASVSISNQNPANVKPYYAFYYAKDFNCYSVPVSQAELKFNYVPMQVPLKKTYIVVSCAEPKGNLTTALEYPDDDVRVVWFKTNNHQGEVVYNASQVDPGDYYAFYYKGGYSLPANEVSTKHVKVENPITPGIPDLGPLMTINSLIFPANGSKDFVVKVQNIKAENSNCSVYFKVSKIPGFTITYSTQAGQSNVNGGMATNNDFWTFAEDNNYITVTSKHGITASDYSVVGFKITRNDNTPAASKQNLSITIPQPGGGGETNLSNNQTITTLITN